MATNMQHFLRCLPKAGFRWPEGDSLTNRDATHKRRDQQIAEVLCHHGGCPNLALGSKKRAAAREVSQALSEMFDQSVDLIHAKVLGSDPNTFAFMSGRLRVHVSWGSAMRADTYMELFHELYKARARWHECPRQPTDIKEHGVLAMAIDRFHEAKGGGVWELKGLDKLARTGGYVHDQEDLDVKEPENNDNDTGPSDTTLTPLVMLKMLYENSVRKDLIKPKEQAGDVENKDGKADDQDLCELRQRVSQVTLGEGTEAKAKPDDSMDLS